MIDLGLYGASVRMRYRNKPGVERTVAFVREENLAPLRAALLRGAACIDLEDVAEDVEIAGDDILRKVLTSDSLDLDVYLVKADTWVLLSHIAQCAKVAIDAEVRRETRLVLPVKQRRL